MELHELYLLQKDLDAEIMRKHEGVDYPSTKEKRTLALLVELGEFSNETRTFKFWSLKGPSAKEIVMDDNGTHHIVSRDVASGQLSMFNTYDEYIDAVKDGKY